MNDIINIRTAKKQDLIDYLTFKCEHRHSAITHPVCYKKWLAATKPQRIGFLDIESGGSLDADWGIVLCWRIKELDREMFGDQIKPAELISFNPQTRSRDKRILQSFCDIAKQFTRLVVYYGKDQQYRHDIPFLRTRCLKWGIDDFPIWKQIEVQDVYDIVKSKFKLSRRRMKDICTLVGIESKQTRMCPDDWLGALGGIPEAIDKIGQHCDEDVIALEKLWKKIIKYKESKTST